MPPCRISFIGLRRLLQSQGRSFHIFYQRRAGEQILETAIAQRGHAAQAMAEDAQVVLWGAIADVGTVAVGGTVARLVGKVGIKAAPSLLRGAERARGFTQRHLGERAAKGVDVVTDVAGTNIATIPGSIKRDVKRFVKGSADDAVRPASLADDAVRPASVADDAVRPSKMTPEQMQARTDAKAARAVSEGVAGDEGSGTILIGRTDPPIRPRTNLPQAEVDRLFEPGRNLTQQELIDKTHILIERAKIRQEILRGANQASQQVPPSRLPGPSDSAILDGETIIDRAVPPGTPAARRGGTTILPEAEMPRGTEIIKPDETIIDRASVGPDGTRKFPAAEMPDGQSANPVRETLDIIADEPMVPPSGTKSPVKGNIEAAVGDEGDFAVDLDTKQGAQVWDEVVRQRMKEHNRRRAAGQLDGDSGDWLHEPPLSQREGFKHLPDKKPVDIPLDGYELSPEHMAELEKQPSLPRPGPKLTIEERGRAVVGDDGAAEATSIMDDPARVVADAFRGEKTSVMTPEESASLDRIDAETAKSPAVEPSRRAGGGAKKDPAKGPKEKLPSTPKEPESEIQLLDDSGNVMTEAKLRELRIEGRKLDAALKKHFGKRKKSPMHVCDAEALAKIKRGTNLKTEGINFSAEGIGTARRGGEAIRVKKRYKKKVHLIKGDARGWIIKYFKNGIKRLPDGTVDISKGQTYIPLEMLEYFDKKAGRWVNFEKPPARGRKTNT